jgi:hypothetical protein
LPFLAIPSARLEAEETTDRLFSSDGLGSCFCLPFLAADGLFAAPFLLAHRSNFLSFFFSFFYCPGQTPGASQDYLQDAAFLLK